MARTVLSVALLVALSLAILHLVSAEQQQQELEDNSNEAVQAKYAEVDQVRILREAEPRRNNNNGERKHGRRRKPSQRRSSKKCKTYKMKNGKKVCTNSRRKSGRRSLGKSNKGKGKKDKKGKKCKTVNGEKVCNNSRKKTGRRASGKSEKKCKNGKKGCRRSKKKGDQQRNKGNVDKKKKKQHQNGPGARQLLCNTAPEASQTISTGIISYRKYYNHDKQIKRTIKDLARLVSKSKPEKLVKFTTAADELKALTTDGTICAADPAKNAEVIATVAALAACAGAASPIVTVCVAPADPPAADLEPKIVVCETAYKPWIAGFKVCFEAKPADCACFVPLNAGTPLVPDEAPMSCAKPNAGGVDWIKDLSVAAKDAVLACKAEITKCKDSITAASALMSACGVKPAATARITNRRRNLLNQALLKSQYNKINLH